MANITIDNGALSQFIISSKALTGAVHVQAVELVTATEAGTRVDLARAEDAPHTSGDMGLMALGVRRDTATALAADGDYMPFTMDSAGRIHVNVGTSLAAARTTDSVAVAMQTDAVMDGLTARGIGYGVIDHAASGNNTIVAAQGVGLRARVHAVYLVVASAVIVRFQSGAGGTALSGQIQLTANAGFVLPFSPIGWFQTAANTLLNMELSAAVSVDGGIVFSQAT